MNLNLVNIWRPCQNGGYATLWEIFRLGVAQALEATSVRSVTAQCDITDVKIKTLEFLRTAWKIKRTLSG